MLSITLSDLFFNHQHPNFDNLFAGDIDHILESKINDAITKDATDFFESFGSICNDYECNSADELVEDFIERL